MGEIGLNAVHPDFAGSEYRYCDVQRRPQADAGGGHACRDGLDRRDSSHAQARRAYQKAGFNVGIPSIWLCQRL